MHLHPPTHLPGPGAAPPAAAPGAVQGVQCRRRVQGEGGARGQQGAARLMGCVEGAQAGALQSVLGCLRHVAPAAYASLLLHVIACRTPLNSPLAPRRPRALPQGPVPHPGAARRHLPRLPGLPRPGPVPRPRGEAAQGGRRERGRCGWVDGRAAAWRRAAQQLAGLGRWPVCRCHRRQPDPPTRPACRALSCARPQIQRRDWSCGACGAERDVAAVEERLCAMLQQVLTGRQQGSGQRQEERRGRLQAAGPSTHPHPHTHPPALQPPPPAGRRRLPAAGPVLRQVR